MMVYSVTNIVQTREFKTSGSTIKISTIVSLFDCAGSIDIDLVLYNIYREILLTPRCSYTQVSSIRKYIDIYIFVYKLVKLRIH